MTPQSTLASSDKLSALTPKQWCWIVAPCLPLVVGPLWTYAWGASLNRVATLSGFVLVAALLAAATTDWRRQKIYNWTTYTAVVWALAINLAASLLADRSEALEGSYFMGPRVLGGVGFASSLIGAGACFFVVLAGFRLSGGGAGDVKLATAIGALLGFPLGLYAVAYSYMAAAVAIIVWSAYANGPLTLVKAAGRTLGKILGPMWPFPPSADDTRLLTKPVPLGPYFAIGTLLVALECVPI